MAGATVHRTRFDPSDASGAFTLTVAAGPDRGAVLLVDGTQPGRVLCGQSEACQLRLTDETVSRRHLALELVNGALVVTDLGSTNGTRINDVRVKEAVIEREAIIELGATRLAVTRASAVAPALGTATSWGGVVGASSEMRRLYPLFAKLAAASIPVVIEGETGTGKEALAEALHQQGPRASHPLVVFDCTAVASNLLEAELFGHERGAFTGADRARPGVFREAHGGTLFIDEIGDLSPDLQPKLLRAIDRGEVRPVGATSAIKVDVRIIAATRRDLDREVQAGHFRDDLFHRLAIGRVELPSLRARRGDIAILARHFWTALGGDPAQLSPSLVQRWESEPWPGNVRELRNTIARHLALGELADLGLRDAPPGAPVVDSADWMKALVDLPLGEARAQVIERFERQYVQGVLEKTAGNVTRAAAHAGVARRYFHLLKAKLGS